MARPIVVSNGELHVGINNYGLVHDFYYPYVGLSNHSAGKSTQHRVGVWVDGQLSWLDTPGEWQIKFRYPQTALVGHTIAKNESLQVVLEFDDFVDAHVSAFMRNIHVVNLAERSREIRLFMHQAFAIDDSRSNTDTAQYLPDSDAVLHYRGRRAFVISGTHNNEPFDQHSVGLFGIEGHEGTWRDAEDGELSNGNVEHGRVDSAIRFKTQIGAHSSTRVQYWITAGSSIREALHIHKQISHDGIGERLRTTTDWWRKWLAPAIATAAKLEPAYHESFLKSVMIIKSQMDKRGAIIASTDSSMLNYNRDAYAYCWPRDGAFVLWPLIRMGYTEEAYRFFEFCRRGMHSGGYLMHKYWADGGLGASWHPYTHADGSTGPPVQEDETALVVFMFAEFYHATNDTRVLRDFYESMIKPMANWMAEYIDDSTGLPRPSYDLWEEVFQTTTYTTATVYAALKAAAELAETQNDGQSAIKWRTVAEDIQTNARKYLFNKDRQAFYKGIINKQGDIHYDATIDSSSIFGSFMFGLFAIDSAELTAAVNTFTERFHDSGIIAYPRYENDNYHRVDPNSSGNWWFITTLWMAQYYLETEQHDLARSILAWISGISTQTSIMSEQISPIDHSLISPSPLTWSHAEYLSALLDTIKKEP